MFKKIVLLALAGLIFTGVGCSLSGNEPAAPVAGDDINNIPLNVTDGSKDGAGTIALDNPQANQELKSPFLVSGTADLPGDRAYVRVKNSAGESVIEAWTAVKTTKGEEGKFSVFINFNFKGTKDGTVEVFGKDANGKEVGLQSVPVKFDVTSSEAIEAEDAE